MNVNDEESTDVKDGRNIDTFEYDFSQAQGSSKSVVATDH